LIGAGNYRKRNNLASARAGVVGAVLGRPLRNTMQLSIRDLTRLLNVAESTVARWIKQRGLPAQQVGGQYRVNRGELLEWATANQVRVSLELFDHLEADPEAVPCLTEALEAGGIHYHLQDTSK